MTVYESTKLATSASQRQIVTSLRRLLCGYFLECEAFVKTARMRKLGSLGSLGVEGDIDYELANSLKSVESIFSMRVLIFTLNRVNFYSKGVELKLYLF